MKSTCLTLFFILVFGIQGQCQVWRNHLDTLLERRQYLSAYEFLDDLGNDSLDVALAKIDLAIDYYYTSQYHRDFGFVNLREGEQLEQLRAGSGGARPLFYLPVDSLLSGYQKEHPHDYRIVMLLGKYYYQIYLLYGDRWGRPSEWLLHQAQQNYLMAYKNGVYDYYGLYVLGYYNTLIENYHEARFWFSRSLQLKQEALTYFNLGVCCLFDGMFNEGVKPAVKAMELFVDSLQKSDAARVAGILYLKTGDRSQALACFDLANRLSPGFKPNQLYLLKTFLDLQENRQAQVLATEVLLESPRDPDLAQEFLDMFEQSGQDGLLKAIFKEALIRLDEDDEAVGNVLFHYAKLEYAMGRRQAGRRRLKEARKHFQFVFDEGHQVFQAIDMMLEKM